MEKKHTFIYSDKKEQRIYTRCKIKIQDLSSADKSNWHIKKTVNLSFHPHVMVI